MCCDALKSTRLCFFFQAEDGRRVVAVTGVQTCALPIFKTHGRRIDDMILRNPAGMKAAMGENPKRANGDAKRMPSTRLGIAALFRDLCVRTENYLAKQAAPDPTKPFERDLKLEQMGM